MNKRFIAFDTETFYNFDTCTNVPFIATTCERVEGQLQSILYVLEDTHDYETLKTMLRDPNIVWIFHNAVYDVYVLSQIDLVLSIGLLGQPRQCAQQKLALSASCKLEATAFSQTASQTAIALAAGNNSSSLIRSSSLEAGNNSSIKSKAHKNNQLLKSQLIKNKSPAQFYASFHDTMLMSQILNENYKAHKLKILAQVYLNETTDENEVLKVIKKELKKNKGYVDYRDIPKEILYPYAIKDAEYTLRLFELFQNKIKPYQKIYSMELALVSVIVDTMQQGMKLDRKFISEQMTYCATRITKAHQDMLNELQKHSIKFIVDVSRSTLRKTWAVSFKKFLEKHELYDPEVIEYDENVSSKTYGKALFRCTEVFSPGASSHIAHVITSLNISDPTLTSKDTIATSKAVLIEYASTQPFFQYLREFRFFTKQLNTYYEPFLNWYTNDANDYAHFAIYQSGAKTGRFSAELIQTMPRVKLRKNDIELRNIRKAFIPTENYTLVCIDYEQIEMRLFVHFSKSKALIELVNQGKDVYLETARKFFGAKRVDDAGAKDSVYRGVTKITCLAIMYGMGKQTLMEFIIAQAGEDVISVQECYEFYTWFFIEIPEVRECISKYTTQIYHNHFVHIAFNSKLMNFSRDYHLDPRMAYKAINCVIQGTAAYVMKTAMLRVDQYVKQNNLLDKIRMIATIHDEIIFEVHNSLDLKETIALLQSLMEDRVTFKVPIVASAKVSAQSWGDAKALQ